MRPDGLGSITSLTAANGAVAQSYTYDSFGNLTNSSGSLTNFFRYAGREFDSETSLYYYRARYYDPSSGHFFSEDPIRFLGGGNFYRYVKNNPIGFTDPSGFCGKNTCGHGSPTPHKPGDPGDDGPGGIGPFMNNYEGGIEDPIVNTAMPVLLAGTGVAVISVYVAGIPEVCATVLACGVYLLHAPVVIGGGAALIYTGYQYLKNVTLPYFENGGCLPE